MAEADDRIDVFVGQVDAAGEGGLSVDDQDFPVVAVVHDGAEDRGDAIERNAADAFRLQGFRVGHGKGGEAAHVVIEDAHVEPFRGLLFQHFMHPVPHLPAGDDEVLEKDELLCLLQFFQNHGEAVIPQGVVVEAVFIILINRESGVAGKVMDLSARGREIFTGPADQFLIICFMIIFFAVLFRAPEAPDRFAGQNIRPEEKVKACSEDRKKKNEKDPHQVGRQVAAGADDIQNDQDANQAENSCNPAGNAAEPVEEGIDQKAFPKDRDEHHGGAVKKKLADFHECPPLRLCKKNRQPGPPSHQPSGRSPLQSSLRPGPEGRRPGSGHGSIPSYLSFR